MIRRVIEELVERFAESLQDRGLVRQAGEIFLDELESPVIDALSRDQPVNRAARNMGELLRGRRAHLAALHVGDQERPDSIERRRRHKEWPTAVQPYAARSAGTLVLLRPCRMSKLKNEFDTAEAWLRAAFDALTA